MSDKCEAERIYGDIIDLPRPQSSRKRMTMHDRAAQFSSFAALSGYEDMVREEGRLTQSRAELSAGELDMLDRKLSFIISLAADGSAPTVSVSCFEPDGLKSGGSYVTVTGRLRGIDTIAKKLELYGSDDIADRRIPCIGIPFENIMDIYCEGMDDFIG